MSASYSTLRAIPLCLLAWLAGCSQDSTTSDREDVETDQRSADEYQAAWVERFEIEDDRTPPFHGIEVCAAEAAHAALGGARLRDAGMTPDEIAEGDVLDLSVRATDVRAFGDGLENCDLAAAYVTAIRATMPAFISEPDAACVGGAISADEEYGLGLAQSILDPVASDWLEAVAPAFNRALVDCPHAYGTITVGGLGLDYGPFPAEGERCLVDGFAGEAAELLSGDSATAGTAILRVVNECLTPLGEAGNRLLEELQ